MKDWIRTKIINDTLLLRAVLIRIKLAATGPRIAQCEYHLVNKRVSYSSVSQIDFNGD